MDSAKAEVPRLLISWAANTWEPGADRVGWISRNFPPYKVDSLSEKCSVLWEHESIQSRETQGWGR